MPSIIQIRDKIKNTIEGVVQDDGTSKITVVYNYAESQPTSYPYAIIDFKGSEEEVHSNRQDSVNYEFEVKIVQEKMEEFKGRANAEETTLERCYSVCQAFRENNDLELSGVIRVYPLKTEKSYVDGGIRIQLTITLIVQVLEEIKVK